MPCRGVQQRVARNGHAKIVFKRLSKRLNTEQDLNRMQATNRLLPMGSLRHKKLRTLFGGWINCFSGQGRIFTGKFAKQVSLKLTKKIGMETTVPSDESQRMRAFLQAARKRKLEVPAMPALNPDNLDTLPMFEAGFLSCNTWHCPYVTHGPNMPALPTRSGA